MTYTRTFFGNRRAVLGGQPLELSQPAERPCSLVSKARACGYVEELELRAAIAQEAKRGGVEPCAAHDAQLA